MRGLFYSGRSACGGMCIMDLALNVDGKPVLVGTVALRTFKTGSRGYQVPGKVTIDGRQYQANVLLTEVREKDANGNYLPYKD